jgi:tricorn protease
MRKSIGFIAFAVLLYAAPARADEPGAARLLRFPATHGDTVVFTYAGDLYTVPVKGGVARRLTSHEGFEMFARFSPDGKTLAFTGQYDGNTEVYVMPAEGGVPRRLTYTATLGRDDVSDRMGPNNIVMGWTPDGKHVVFRSRMREPNDFIGQLYLVPAAGGLPKQLPLPRGGFCSFSPDGKKLAYNRIFREFRTWKRYRGGMADDVWIHDFESKETVNLTKNPASDIIPMWSGNKIYFLSDRDPNKRMNLFVQEVGADEAKQLTHFTEYDVRFPSLGDTAIVFENGGHIYRLDLSSQKAAKVPVRILEDRAPARTALRDVSKNVASYEISPDGKRALFSARGDLFTVPAKDGPTRNLTASSGIHERNPKWSADGKWVAFISDASGEDEIHILPQEGGKSKQLTSNGDTYKYALEWSPDGKKILWADKKLRLQFVDVETRKVKQVDQAKAWEIRSYSWSPDSKWVAYVRPEEEGEQKVYIHSLEAGKSYPVTDRWFASFEPVFSPDGKYLYFVSNRDFTPIFSRTEWNHAYQDMARIYLVTLQKSTPHPFPPRSDEVSPAGKEAKGKQPEKDAKDGKDGKGEKKKPVAVKVDLEGLSERVVQLPVPVASYFHLTPVGESLYYVRRSAKDGKPTLAVYDLAQRKETSLGNATSYEISFDRKKMLVSKDSNYHIIDLPKAPFNLSAALNLSGLQVQLDRRQEWKQIFHECWRQMRDFFYDPGLHGVDWRLMKKRYAPLVEHVSHRADLTYVIGEMISELNAGHAYVGGGDLPKVKRIQTGLLGAELEQDRATKFYKIKRILKGANWNNKLRSPLTEIGVNVKEGEYIVAVNGRPTNELANVYEALVNTAGKQVRLTIKSGPAEKASREVTVTPIADEQPLYYYNWVQNNIRKVSEASKGQVGYIHVPDMQANGLNEFVKHFYPQLRKKALVIDMRGNGGGNVSPHLIERLLRSPAMIGMARNVMSNPNPFDLHLGPKVCLLNEFSASDGDLFPFRFRHYKLGKLVGKRSWGGVVGIRGSLPLLDGGYLMKPEFASYDLTGKEWIIENHGVDPDIVVENDPAREYAGTDEQLDRAIAVVLEELRNNPRPLPPPPPFPKR